VSLRNFLLKTEAPKFEIVSENIFVFQFTVDKHHLDGLENFISTKNISIEWIGGVKLERSIYLKGSGPVYKALEKSVIFINEKAKNLDKGEILNLQDFPNGEHTIQPLNARKINFQISEPKYERYLKINPSGWNLKEMKHSSLDWNISGLLLKSSKSTITIRNFIDLSVGEVKDVPEKNQILNILSKQKTKKW